MTICPTPSSSSSSEVWCFQCGAGYLAEVSVCTECGVATVPQPPIDAAEVGGPSDGQLEYDFHEYSAESRSMLESLLLGAKIPHAWHGAVLIVGERDESKVDELVAGVDRAARPALEPSAETVGYELGEMSDDEVTRLTEVLEEAEVTYGFDVDGDLEVYAADEERVDALMDKLAEEVVAETFGPGLEGVDPHAVVSRLFLASDRLARNPRDRKGLRDLKRFGEDVLKLALPFGFEAKVWRSLLDQVSDLREVAQDGAPSEISSAAASARDVLHRFV